MERKHAQTHNRTQTPEEQAEVHIQQRTAPVDQELVSETDNLLAEIDGLLEENAEDFVKGFVQKGGE